MISCGTNTKQGFSLIEVVVSLGIVAIAVSGVLGVLSTAMTTTKDNDRETMLVSMNDQVMTDLRVVPFDALWQAVPHSAAISTASSAQTAPEDTLYYFTNEAVLIPGTAPTSDATYLCTVKKTPDADSQNHGVNGAYNLLKLQLHFSWPLSAPEANRRAAVINTSLARY